MTDQEKNDKIYAILRRAVRQVRNATGLEALGFVAFMVAQDKTYEVGGGCQACVLKEAFKMMRQSIAALPEPLGTPHAHEPQADTSKMH